jgi:hypothetical protein
MKMETRGGWGIVYVAAGFAVVAIVAALTTAYLEKQHRDAQVTAVTKSLADWRSVSDVPTTTPPAPLADNVSADLFKAYGTLVDQGSFTASERDNLVAGIVEKNVSPQVIVPNISLADLTIKEGAPVDTYLKLLTVILSQSSQVKEYEITVFTRTVSNGTTTGTPELQSDALLYQRIAAAIILMDVPPALAKEHLEVAKSVGALAKATADMAAWKGDPIEALSDADAFNKAESYVETSVNNLLAAAKPLLQKKT